MFRTAVMLPLFALEEELYSKLFAPPQRRGDCCNENQSEARPSTLGTQVCQDQTSTLTPESSDLAERAFEN